MLASVVALPSMVAPVVRTSTPMMGVAPDTSYKPWTSKGAPPANVHERNCNGP